MMLPNTLSSKSPMPAAMPSATATMTPGEVGDDGLTHADYNLQPLLVKSLDHYVIPVDESELERFHIR
ncbi:hypothetical protein [Rhodanobacter glycinis]|uniref:hypothetical protein n=1 Tax=Rhodanobacter glycinis TaxID=582702 RepID=UPI00112D6A06|nr:hypothetical protein [Rhodanobacter glycinis]